MRTTIILDEMLMREAFSYAKTIHTKKELVETALTEFVNSRKRKNIGELVGKIRFHKGYNYKNMRVGR